MRKNLLSFLADAERHQSETALIWRDGLRLTKCSYGQLRTSAFQIARELEIRGISKGERVIIWAANRPAWVAAFFGCLLRRAIVVPLDQASTPEFVSRVQDQVQAKLLIADSSTGCFGNLPPCLSMDELMHRAEQHSNAAYSDEGVEPDEIVEIIFTSGTTAEPKGVCITHRNLVVNLEPIEREIQKYLKWERFFHPIRFLNLLPLSHVFGQFMGIFVPQVLVGETVLSDGHAPSEIVSLTKRQRISVIVAVPRMLESLAAQIERDFMQRGLGDQFKRRLASAETASFFRRWWLFRDVHRQFGWKFWAFVSGGAALSEETEAFWRKLGFAVVQGYGMTETASLVSVSHPFKLARRSIGKKLPGQEVKLNERGEILVRGDNVSPGYWSDGLARLTDEQGWLRTGDLGEMDEAGNLYFKGRAKDVIVTSAGMNVYPEDLEAALRGQSEVRDCVVVGVETVRGPEPVAVLIMRDPADNPANAVRVANKGLGPYQQIRHWCKWPEPDFPRTPTEKVRKMPVTEFAARALRQQSAIARGKELREPVRDGGGLDESSPASFILETVARLSGEPEVSEALVQPVDADLKLDSLGRVALLSALEERYQLEIDETAFTEATTLADLDRLVREGTGESATRFDYPTWPQRVPFRWIRILVFYALLLPLTRFMSRLRVSGRERLKGFRGPVLFISNHVSIADQSLIQAALPGRFRRRLAIAMEGERLRGFRRPATDTGFFRRINLKVQYLLALLLFNVFPLPQKSGFRRSFSFAGESVDRGYSVLVFPEGRRSEDGEMHGFRDGIGLLSTNLNIPVVPIRIDGLYELKQQGRRFARPGEVRVIIGDAINFSRGDDPASIARELEQRVRSL